MATVDDRLNVLENELTILRKQLAKHLDSVTEECNSNWIERVAGSFRNEPEFDEVLRLGREARQSESIDVSNGMEH
jgi:hypothetical protein